MPSYLIDNKYEFKYDLDSPLNDGEKLIHKIIYKINFLIKYILIRFAHKLL